MGRVVPGIAALLLAACSQPQLPPAASAESIEQAVTNAEREMATAKAKAGQGETSLVGA
jgi:outer membrane biogenesis lipoprotein LolB